MFVLCRCGVGLLRVTGSKHGQNICQYVCVAYIYRMKIELESRRKYSSLPSSKNNLKKFVSTKIVFEHANHKNNCKSCAGTFYIIVYMWILGCIIYLNIVLFGFNYLTF